RAVPEARIEEARVMHPELSRDRHVGHHLGRRGGGDADLLAADEDVEGAGVENDAAEGAWRHRLPELVRVVLADAIEVDQPGMTPGAPADDALAARREIDRKAEPAIDEWLPVHQRVARMQRAQGLVVDR